MALRIVVIDDTTGQVSGQLTVPESSVASLVADLLLKAPLLSPAFTGAPTAPDPSTAQGVATQGWVQAQINDFDIKLAVRAATQANIAFTRSGNVYTAGALGVLLKATIDSGWSTGAALAVGDRILLANQTSNVDNGIVTVTDLGTIGTNANLTRSTDMNTSAEVTSEMRVPVTEGTDANLDYKLSAAGPFTLNTTGLPFTKAGGPPTGPAGGGLSGLYPNPAVATTLDAIPAPTANVSLNSHKITALTPGAASGEGATWSQTPAGIVTAKGDLVVATASGAVARHGVGTDGQILVADSSQNDGVAWAMRFPAVKPATGEWITSQFGLGNQTSGSEVLNDMYAVPIWVSAPFTTSEMDITINTATATAVHRLGIYNSVASGRPGTLVVDAGTVASASTGIKSLSVSQALAAGLYWLVAVPQVALARYRAFSSVPLYPIAGTSSLTISTPGANLWRVQSVSGALPLSPTWAFAGNSNVNAVPVVGLVAA